MPRPKKPAGAAADKRNGQRLELVPLEQTVLRPALPDGLRDEAAERWHAYWDDGVAAASTSADHGLLVRWVRWVSLWHEAMDRLAAEPLVEGSTGQWVASPWSKLLAQAEAGIQAAEDRLGMSPKSRAQLGIAIGEAKKTLDDLNREANAAASAATGPAKAAAAVRAEAVSDDPRVGW